MDINVVDFILVQERLGGVVIRSVFIIFFLGLAFATYRADSFIDLWLTADQQGNYLYHQQDYIKAAQRFDDSYRKGLSYYAGEDFYNAIAILQTVETTQALFTIANAYAQLELLQESIEIYTAVLVIDPDFAAAQFNLNWVTGLKALDDKEFDDAGGTDGKLKADEFVIDNKADNALGEISAQEIQAQGLSDEQMQALWMRRVQTTPGDFLAYKFAYQVQQGEQP